MSRDNGIARLTIYTHLAIPINSTNLKLVRSIIPQLLYCCLHFISRLVEGALNPFRRCFHFLPYLIVSGVIISLIIGPCNRYYVAIHSNTCGCRRGYCFYRNNTNVLLMVYNSLSCLHNFSLLKCFFFTYIFHFIKIITTFFIYKFACTENNKMVFAYMYSKLLFTNRS